MSHYTPNDLYYFAQWIIACKLADDYENEGDEEMAKAHREDADDIWERREKELINTLNE